MRTKTLAWPTRRLFALTSALFLIVTLAGCGGGGGSDDSRSGSSSIGPGGGTVTSGTTTLSIPAGALISPVSILLNTLSLAGLATPTGKSVLSAVTCGPEGQTFASPVSLTMQFASPRTPFAKLLVLVLNNATLAWSGGNAAQVSADGKSATTTTKHFSTFLVLDSPTLDARWNLSLGQAPNWGYVVITYGSLSGSVISFTAELHDTASPPDPERMLDGTFDFATDVCQGTWHRPEGGGADTGAFDITADAQLTSIVVTIRDDQG